MAVPETGPQPTPMGAGWGRWTSAGPWVIDSRNHATAGTAYARRRPETARAIPTSIRPQKRPVVNRRSGQIDPTTSFA